MLFKINSHTELNVTLYSENTLQILLKATWFPKDDHFLHLLEVFFWQLKLLVDGKQLFLTSYQKIQTIATKKLSIECNNPQSNKEVC